MSLSISLLGIALQNPLVLASGIRGSTGASLADIARAGAGAVTSKSVSKEPRSGHASPTMTAYEGGMINAVGLSNPGMKEFLQEFKFAIEHSPAPVIASIFSGSGTYEEFGELTAQVAALKPAAIEIDISCPHVHGVHFANDKDAAAEVTRVVKKNSGKIPVSMKLSPNVSDIAEIARAVEDAGADLITAVNTAGPGMLINIEARKPILGNKRGGVSGAALKPIALRCVYDIYAAVQIPIIGTGGVSTGRDAIEMMMAGATAVGIGTAYMEGGNHVFKNIQDEMVSWMEHEGVKNISEIIGAAHA